MYPQLFKTEEWIISVTSETRSLINDGEYVFVNEDIFTDYITRAKALSHKLSFYRDTVVVQSLDTELKEGQFDKNKTPLLTRYVNKVAAKFENLWMTGLDFGEFYRDRSLEIRDKSGYKRDFRSDETVTMENDLKEVLYDIRSFYKHETWDDGPYNEDPTLESVLIEYSGSGKDSEHIQSEDENSQAYLSPRFSWSGSKTDLAELIWALSKSRRLVKADNGNPVTQAELTQYFEALIGQSINTMGLMQGRKSSYKSANDGLTFTAFLSEQVDKYIANQ